MESLEPAFAFVKEHLDPAMGTGSYSIGFLMEMAVESYRKQLNVFRIVDEIAALEGKPGRGTSTKPPTMFRGKHLYGYWHKHHTHARYLVKNIGLEMERDDTVQRVLGKYIGQELTPKVLNELVHALVIGNYMTRAGDGRLTGEWIVYSRVEGRNKYLTLARHDEGDEAIAERVHRHEEMDLKTGWDSATSVLTNATSTLMPEGWQPP